MVNKISKAFSFNGWNLKTWLASLEKPLVALVGAMVIYFSTNNPAFAGIAGALASLLYALIKFYVKDVTLE